MPACVANQLLADLVKRAGEELGQSFGQELRRGTSDANFYGTYGVPTVDGIGPICKGYHTADEYVEIPSIKLRTALLANALVTVGSHYGEASLQSGRK